ncbi:MAG: phenylacetate--CoA ligase [Oscillospiraceae bacterium]|jgi:phenylacetate-CoA ligase|nr:phenylacetate--CoA ligase [Oscillospiraceae bacterium]
MTMPNDTLAAIRGQVRMLKTVRDGFYAKRFADVDADDIKTQADFETLPFTDKDALRDAYPLGLAAVPARDIVRIHSSSGTTGTPVIIPYTRQDVLDWAIMFKRCYEIAGVTEDDRVHITPGYGLWTAGIGFQAGAELLGAMAIPMGPGNTDKQLQFMQDLGSTVLTATSSYALLLAEEIERRGIRDKLKLRKALIGSERWGEKMRARIASELGVSLYDIYGLTEIYGPGIGISCDAERGMHMFDDFVYSEVIDPKTGEVVPDGELGELVITTLRKQGAPLIRYRTHDLTRMLGGGECACGCEYPRIDTILGRTDDMVKIKGVNVFPGQIDDMLKGAEGVSSEYQVMIDHFEGRDRFTLFFETEWQDESRRTLERDVAALARGKLGFTIVPMGVSIGELPRSEKKSTRIFDNRY